MKSAYKLYIFSIILASIIVLCPSYVFVSPDNESFMSTVLSTIFQARAIRDGYYPFWTSLLGFGMPQPFSQSLYFHPILFLFALLPTKLALILFYQSHLIFGGISMWALCLEVKITSKIAFACTLTYLLSASTLNYSLTDFWPSVFLLWTFLPFFWLTIIRLLQAKLHFSKLYYSLWVGLVAGLMFLNGHSGVTATYFVITVIFIIAFGRNMWQRLPWFILSLLIFLLLAGGRIYHFSTEYAFFAEDIYRTYIGHSVFNLEGIWALLFKPLYPGSFKEILIQNYSIGTRIVWFGGIFIVFALVGAFHHRVENPYRKVLAITFVFSFVAIHLPSELCFRVVAWMLAFRDPLTISGILLAGIALTSLTQKKDGYLHTYHTHIILLHIVFLVVGAFPFWLKNFSTAIDNSAHNQSHNLLLNPYETTLMSSLNQSEFIKKISRFQKEEEGRLYFSKKILESGNISHQQDLTRNAFAFHGIRVVPGYFKGISYDKVYPDNKLMHGHIEPQASVLVNKPLLDVLGIRYILATPLESVHPELELLNTFNIYENTPPINLYINNEAWPDAVVMNDNASEIQLDRINPCENDRLLCADFSDVKSLRLESPKIKVSRKHGSIYLTKDPSSEEELIMVTEYYRDGWKAFGLESDKTKKALTVLPVSEQFVGIRIPAGTTEIKLIFQPATRIVLEWVSWLGIMIAVTVLTCMSFISRKIRRCMNNPQFTS